MGCGDSVITLVRSGFSFIHKHGQGTKKVKAVARRKGQSTEIGNA